ncbi:hypothetical protein GALMADRAFT_258131 [Galerina marginata CBS 339.88]|uniref:F-box domain-containing protein n=1 Tax=Galerina marginata (strain CBS 339.88) TaxID=685588 RepID=A0A067SL88_GALM3|nr:hypothetical protein GALMADRAFT_258131 [Galerina marginata CBS 339.88]
MNKKKNGVVLPYDLERDIFELAARAFPGHAVKLCTISRYVQEWMERIIYETVVLDLPLFTTKLFLRTFYSRPTNFFARNVKRLYMTNFLAFPEAREIVAACAGLTDLVCWADPISKSQGNFVDLLSPACIRHLSVKIDALWGISTSQSHFKRQFTPHLFPNLSHLEIVNPPGSYSATQVDWDGLRALPKLTHLAVGDLWHKTHLHFIPHFEQTLVQCENLKVLLLISQDDGFVDELRKSGIQQDSRVVVKTEFNSPLPLSEYWDSVRQGGPDFWGLADRMALENSRSPPEALSRN